MKIFFRIVVLNIIIGFVLSFFFPFTISKPVSELQSKEWLLAIWVILSAITGLFWWAYLFYHWGTNDFKSKNVKKIWFWVILLGTMLYLTGPLFYYIFVYEMGKGLRQKIASPDNI